MVGPHTKLALTRWYNKFITKDRNIQEGFIRIQKKMTCKRGMKLKVLLVYYLESYANGVDKDLMILLDKPLDMFHISILI